MAHGILVGATLVVALPVHRHKRVIRSAAGHPRADNLAATRAAHRINTHETRSTRGTMRHIPVFL